MLLLIGLHDLMHTDSSVGVKLYRSVLRYSLVRILLLLNNLLLGNDLIVTIFAVLSSLHMIVMGKLFNAMDILGRTVAKHVDVVE